MFSDAVLEAREDALKVADGRLNAEVDLNLKLWSGGSSPETG